MESSYDTSPQDHLLAGYQNTETMFYPPNIPYISSEGRVPSYHPTISKASSVESCNQIMLHTNDVTGMENYQKCKRRLQFSPYCIPDVGLQRHYVTSTGTTRRNARERNRVKTINSTFAKLREHLPQSIRGRKTRKMSKVDTLRAAIEYISCLQDLLDNEDAVNAVFNENFTSSEVEEAVPSPSNSQQFQDHFHLQSHVSPSTSQQCQDHYNIQADLSGASFSPCSSLDEAQSPVSSSSSCSPPLEIYPRSEEQELTDFNGWF